MFKFFIFLSIFFGCAFAKTPVKDVEKSAVEARDFTGLIESPGCISQLIPGWSYCRKKAGEMVGTEALFFVGPVTNCKRDACVEFKIYGPEGDVIAGDSIPRKSFRSKPIYWKDLLKRSTFELNDGRLWVYRYRVVWVNDQGNEEVSISEGEIRLRVIAADYTPLHEVKNDSNFTWKFQTKNGEDVKITTGMRTYVSPRPK